MQSKPSNYFATSQYRRTLRALHDRSHKRDTIRLVRDDGQDQLEDKWLEDIRGVLVESGKNPRAARHA